MIAGARAGARKALGPALLAAFLLVLPAAGAVGAAGAVRPMPQRASALAEPPTDRHNWVNETAVTRLPSPERTAYTPAVYDPALGAAVAYGGLGANGTVGGTTWIFDDGNWEDITPLLTGASPPPLSQAGLAFDGVDGYLLLFGGRTAGGAPYGGTWSFSNYAWTNRTATPAPPAESGGGLAYDPGSALIVLEEPNSNGTWTYHAGQWQRLDPVPNPGARTGEVMVTDSTGGYVLLFGGRPASGGPSENDTWTYTRGNWTRQPAEGGPAPLLNASGTDDPFLNGSLVVGNPAGGPIGTWLWTDAGWTEYAAADPPPGPRLGATLAFDPSGAVALCGGTGPGGAGFADTCWAWGVAYLPTNPASTAAPISPDLVGLLLLVVAVPVAAVYLLGRRPKRPDVTRAPSAAPA